MKKIVIKIINWLKRIFKAILLYIIARFFSKKGKTFGGGKEQNSGSNSFKPSSKNDSKKAFNSKDNQQLNQERKSSSVADKEATRMQIGMPSYSKNDDQKLSTGGGLQKNQSGGGGNLSQRNLNVSTRAKKPDKIDTIANKSKIQKLELSTTQSSRKNSKLKNKSIKSFSSLNRSRVIDYDKISKKACKTTDRKRLTSESKLTIDYNGNGVGKIFSKLVRFFKPQSEKLSILSDGKNTEGNFQYSDNQISKVYHIKNDDQCWSEKENYRNDNTSWTEKENQRQTDRDDNKLNKETKL